MRIARWHVTRTLIVTEEPGIRNETKRTNEREKAKSTRFRRGRKIARGGSAWIGRAGAPGARNLPAKHFRPNEKWPQHVGPFHTNIHERTQAVWYTRIQRGSIPRELHQGMRGRIRRTSQFTGPRIIQGQQSIYLQTVYTRHFSLTSSSASRKDYEREHDRVPEGNGCWFYGN